MSEYVDLPWNKKLHLLNDHDISGKWKNLEQTRWCLHCGKQFDGFSVRVWQDSAGKLWLECGTPDCDGSPIDWAPYPWWDENHPATREYLENPPPPDEGSGEDDIPF